jgi:hypothetical protein
VGVDISVDVTEEDQIEGRLVPEDTGGMEEEFPRVVVVVEALHRAPLGYMEQEYA